MRRLAGSLLLYGCTSSAPPAEPPLTVELPGLGLRIDVPTGTEVSRSWATQFADTKTPWTSPVKLEFSPGQRYPRTMTIADTDEHPDASLDLSDGLLRYHVTAIDGGMSEQRELIGHLELAGHRLAVRCDSTGEAGEEPSLEWCLAALRSLRE